MRFDGMHVVVTGGTGALGTAVVARLLELGATCNVPARRAPDPAQYAPAGHANLHVVSGIDLTDEAAVAGFYDTIPTLWASMHVAGGFALAPIADIGKATLGDMLGTNLVTCALCCRAAIAAIRARPSPGQSGGRIVNVAARPALEPRTGGGMTAYTASKAAVAAFTQALAQEVAGEGIWVNAVAPSVIDTPANRAAMPKADHGAWPKPDEIARTIIFLASADNLSTRGAVIPVYGRS